jgi:hypothetical protein
VTAKVETNYTVRAASNLLFMTPKTTAPPEQHLTSSAMLQDIVIGLSDGLTVPFALAAGLSGAVQSSGLVITAGLAEIVAGSIAMGLGGYLAGRTEVDHYAAELAREHEEVRTVPDTERQEVQELLREMGLSEATAAQATAELVQDPAQWVHDEVRIRPRRARPTPGLQKRIYHRWGLRRRRPHSAERVFSHGHAAAGLAVVGRYHPGLPAGIRVLQKPPHWPGPRSRRA